MANLEKLEALEKAATSAPWQARFMFRSLRAARGTDGLFCESEPDKDWPDAELIAAMRNALPKLLAVIRAAIDLSSRNDWHPDLRDCACKQHRDFRAALAALEEP